MRDVGGGVASAIRQFWKTRDLQSKRQGSTRNRRDQGARTAVTGGKQMDGFINLLVIDNATLLVAAEFKSQVGPSFGNNYNNRSEEAIRNAQDIWTAFREGAFSASQRPWLGYMMLLEDTNKSTCPVAVREPHFSVFSEFSGASYAERYTILLEKLVRERMYDSACFLMSKRTAGLRGQYSEPVSDLRFEQFAASLVGRLVSYNRRT